MTYLSRGRVLLAALLGGCPAGGENGGGDDDGTSMLPSSSGAQTATGGSTSAGPSSGGPTTQSNTTSGPVTSSSGDTTIGDSSSGSSGGEVSSVLLTIDDISNPTRLVRIDTATGEGSEVCQLAGSASYNSITFARDNTLFAHNTNNGRIERINPCDCGFQIVGLTGAMTLELTSDEEDGLLAIDAPLHAFATVNRETGLATVVGSLGYLSTEHALVWSDATGEALSIDAELDQLYAINPLTGAGENPVPLSIDLVTPGAEILQATDTLFACSADVLYTINPTTGQVSTVGTIGLSLGCDNLAAPFSAIGCLE